MNITGTAILPRRSAERIGRPDLANAFVSVFGFVWNAPPLGDRDDWQNPSHDTRPTGTARVNLPGGTASEPVPVIYQPCERIAHCRADRRHDVGYGINADGWFVGHHPERGGHRPRYPRAAANVAREAAEILAKKIEEIPSEGLPPVLDGAAIEREIANLNAAAAILRARGVLPGPVEPDGVFSVDDLDPYRLQDDPWRRAVSA